MTLVNGRVVSATSQNVEDGKKAPDPFFLVCRWFRLCEFGIEVFLQLAAHFGEVESAG